MFSTVVFDFGGVLIDWSPRYLFQPHFEDENKLQFFLDNICTGNWNEMQDAGRSLQEGTEVLMNHFPEWETEIKMFYGQWHVMLKGPMPKTVDILYQLKHQGVRLLGLTNWSAETFPIALQRFEFLSLFEHILVSGQEKLIKPDRAIFQLLIKRYNLVPSETIFIDDNIKNVAAARAVGIEGVHYSSSHLLQLQLKERGIILKEVLL
jgi:2-haloacid dehalogenase